LMSNAMLGAPPESSSGWDGSVSGVSVEVGGSSSTDCSDAERVRLDAGLAGWCFLTA
jgi:hypothetical protein